MLSKSSVLHYWDARYGPIPIIGGKPVHSRSSAGAILDQRGVLHRPIINTPRFGWDTIAGERRQAMLLEMARTNYALQSSDFSNASWIKENCTVATGKLDPMGGTAACSLTSTLANGKADQPAGSGLSSIARTGSVWLRRRTGTGTIQILNGNGSAWATVAVTDQWARFTVTGPGTTDRQPGIRLLTSGDAVDAWGYNLEDAARATSEIPTTTAAATRSADSFYWDYPHAPQGMMVYCRFVETGTLLEAGRLIQFGKADNTAPRFIVYSGGTFYTGLQDNGVASNPVLAVAPVIGDTVELLAILYADGHTDLIQSINGAAVTSAVGGNLPGLSTAWTDTRLWLNSINTTAVGANRFAELKVVKYADVVGATAQARTDELRAFELSPAGEVLS